MSTSHEVDVVIVGAGFAGMYMLHKLRGMGMSAVVFEQGDNVGGTWYWNRYPGARCDAESLAYSFSFSEELEQEWDWTERYATQPEILKYAEHVADRFDLRRDIHFNQTVERATFDSATNTWTVTTAGGMSATGHFCVMATGCLSVPMVPEIDGLDSFAGARYQASQWPHETVDFSGQRVGIIGTGSSAIQAIPVIAAQAKTLTVFQRTPNFSVPAVNHKLDPSWVESFKQYYRDHRRNHKLGLGQGFGDLTIEPVPAVPELETSEDATEEECIALLEKRWQAGGAQVIGAMGDIIASERANRITADFVRHKIRETVKDPATADLLCPTSHPIGTKRICVDTEYYETYNLPHVSLVDIRSHPITRITPNSICTDNAEYEIDTLVLATGFDAMTGALLRIDIRGEGGQSLEESWKEGPKTYLGMQVAGFPNLFTITGPGSPSVLSNMIVSIEQHVDWMTACLGYMKEKGLRRVEPDRSAQEGWVAHVNEVAAGTLFPQAGSWYMGANIPGKPRVFMPYAAGVGPYREICDDVAANGYRGFNFA